MFNRVFKRSLILIVITFLVLMLSSCQETKDIGDFSYITYDDITYEDYEYNKNLYYLNELKFEIADPDVIFITEGEEKGYFYAYGTSDLVQCHGIQTWRSLDLTNWEYRGVAFEPDYSETWAYNNYWAPEVIYDDGVYYMFYSAFNVYDHNRPCMSVAISQNPYGPFVCPDNIKNADGVLLKQNKPVYDFSSNLPGREGISNNCIDIHPFIDPVTNEKYMYFSAYQSWGNSRSYQEIFGCKMKDWFTPDYSTLKQLTSIFNSTVEDFSEEMIGGSIQFGDINEGQNEGATVNEGPYVYYHEGNYYLTFSVYPYTSPNYQLRQAIATSPLGDYTKVELDKGGTFLKTNGDWENLQSAGHHCFIELGDQLMVAYHTFKDRRTIASGRALAVDYVNFVKNQDGVLVMQTNGPTYSLQPLPEFVTGYKNIAPLSTHTVSLEENNNSELLFDGLVKVHPDDLVKEFETPEVDENTVLKINLKYDKWYNVRSILLYNSIDYDYSLPQIGYIKMKVNTVNGEEWVEATNVKFNYEWNSDSRSTMYPGGAIIAEFMEMSVKEIEIGISLSSSINKIKLNELMVMGKETTNPVEISKFDKYTYQNPEDVLFIKHPEGDMVGSSGSFHTTWGYGDLSTDDGTENRYIENTAPGDQFAYFKDAKGLSFYFEAELTITETRPYRLISGAEENYPKFGLVLKSNGGSTFFYIDSAFSGGFNLKQVGYTQRKHDNSDYDWTNTEKVRQQEISYTNGEYTKLAIARINDDFYFYVNDVLFAHETSLRGMVGEEVYGGCLVFNMGIKVRNYQVINGEAKVLEKVTQLGNQ